MKPLQWLTLVAVFLLVSASLVTGGPSARLTQAAPAKDANPDRSPVDLLLTKDQRRIVTANQTAGTVSVVDVASGQVLQEVSAGEQPAALAFTPDEKRLLVTCLISGDLVLFRFDGDKLEEEGRIHLGFEPRGVALSPDGKTAYVALTSGHAVAVVDLDKKELVTKVPTGKWPRFLAVGLGGQRLAVGCSGDRGVAVHELPSGKLIHLDNFLGLNLGMMQTDQADKEVYFPFMVYRNNPITQRNIEIGWVLASRLGHVTLDKQPGRRAAFSLDKQGEAVADPHGIALSPDETWLVSTMSGSQELLVLRREGLPFERYGSTDHIPPDLYRDSNRFYRLHLGGRPMACRFAANGREVFIANYMLNAVQVVDIEQRKITRTISLGRPKEPSLARRGEALFYDGKRSHDQWYSCHSCHYEGHTSSVAMDTRNDGRFGNYKTVLTLRHVTKTGPYTWHGWQKKLEDSVSKSFSETMLGKEPTDDEVKAVIAYLETLQDPPNPYLGKKGELSAAAERGKLVFASEKAGCVRCHSGDYFTDGKLHEVGLAARTDVYKGFNPPTLRGTFDRILYLHDGRAKSLEEVLTGPHSPAKVTKKGDLTKEELADLIEYLKSL